MAEKTPREIFQDAGLTQRQVALLLDVDDRTVRRWCQRPEDSGYRVMPATTRRLFHILTDRKTAARKKADETG
jgi:hypothetical protein